MAIITFTSDFGTRDHYVAAVKARIYYFNSNIQVVDITHHVDHYNIAHGAFVLNALFRDFPKGTVHLVAVNSHSHPGDKYVAVRLEDHFFVGRDNGIFSLLSEKIPVIVELPSDKFLHTTFPEKNLYAFAAVSLASGKSIYDIGVQVQGGFKKMFNRQLKTTKNSVEGHVLHVDDYGNLITNINKKTFEEVAQNRVPHIMFARENIRGISLSYYQIEEGECAIVFNDLGLLEIAINQGNAALLLGLKYDSPVQVQFDN